MFIERDTVIELLKRNERYDENLTTLNLLPKNTIFSILIDDSVTAEFYDEDKDQLYIFELDYDYLRSGVSLGEVQQNQLSTEIKESLDEETNYKMLDSSPTSFLFYIVTLFIVFVIVPIIIIWRF